MRYRDTVSPGVRLSLITKGNGIKAILSNDKKTAASICGRTGGDGHDRA